MHARMSICMSVQMTQDAHLDASLWRDPEKLARRIQRQRDHARFAVTVVALQCLDIIAADRPILELAHLQYGRAKRCWLVVGV